MLIECFETKHTQSGLHLKVKPWDDVIRMNGPFKQGTSPMFLPVHGKTGDNRGLRPYDNVTWAGEVSDLVQLPVALNLDRW